ncbi:lysine-rich arabinogalactan protein 19-like [Humulus lupulus]|uniref:lysine-rich arabinogalactan protein 19-like n=1 Tax=Humulus lupulus TaxID=3486 RepID=UPI002B4100D1|nr:lysine-rich arabinogalactan protein 19-like [Humulus lupulus]
MKERENLRRSVLPPSPVANVTVSPPPRVAVPPSVDASGASSVATPSDQVVSSDSYPSLVLAIVLLLPTVSKLAPPPSMSPPAVVTESMAGLVDPQSRCFVGKPSNSSSVSSPKRFTRSSVVSSSPPRESPPLLDTNPPTPSPPKSPCVSKHSSPKRPKTRSGIESNSKTQVPAQSKGKEKVFVS